MLTKFTHTEVLELLRDSVFEKRGLGLLISGPSRDERSAMANAVLGQLVEAGCSYLSLSPFEVVAANHFGQRKQLVRRDVLLISELGALSQAEQAAIDVIDPIFTVTSTLESILDQRQQHGFATLVTTDHELPELATQFSDRLANLVERLVLSIRLDGEDGEPHADRP